MTQTKQLEIINLAKQLQQQADLLNQLENQLHATNQELIAKTEYAQSLEQHLEYMIASYTQPLPAQENSYWLKRQTPGVRTVGKKNCLRHST